MRLSIQGQPHPDPSLPYRDRMANSLGRRCTVRAKNVEPLFFRIEDLKPNALLGVGVDRLDYTKGIEERLLAVERLSEHP